MKKLFKNNTFKQIVIISTTLILCLLMFFNVTYWGQLVINKQEVNAENKDAVSFDNKFDFDPADTNYTSKYIYWSEFVKDISEDRISKSETTISENNYTYGHDETNSKRIVLESANDYKTLSDKCISTDAKVRQFYLNNYYVLGNNIDCKSIGDIQPIGNYTYPFTGIFDGQGFEIYNATLHEISSSSSDGSSSDTYFSVYSLGYDSESTIDSVKYYSRHGFFAYNKGIIRNLGMVNPIIQQKRNFADLSNNNDVESYVSLLVGVNMENGEVYNTYVLDSEDFANEGVTVDEKTLGATIAEGAIGGLVGQNNGSLHDSYVIADYLYYANNESFVPIDVQPVVVTNKGTISNVYYNASRYKATATGDGDYKTRTIDGITGVDTSNDDSNFTNYSYFSSSSSWYLKKESLLGDYDYPKLFGLTLNSNGNISITKPYDFILMSEIIDDQTSGLNAEIYSLDSSIDMRCLAKDIFKTISNAFQGTLLSSKDESGNNYYVYNLVLNTNSSSDKNYAIFQELDGATIKDISFSNITINCEYDSSNTTSYNASMLANEATGKCEFNNVQLHGNINLDTATSTTYGGFVSYVNNTEASNITFESCSTSGEFVGGSNNTSVKNYIGGFVGNASNSSSCINISNCFNKMNFVNIGSSSSSNSATSYIGGIIGYGIINNLEKVGNKGNISSNDLSSSTSYPNNTLYMGGIVGYLTNYYHDVTNDIYGVCKQVTNGGNLKAFAYTSSQLLQMAGFGNVKFSSSSTNNTLFYGITNTGTLTLTNKGSIQSVSQTLGTSGFFVTPGIIVDSTSATINGLYNTKDQSIDIPILPTYAPNLYTNNTSSYTINLSNSYNKGNLTFTMSNVDTNLHHYYLGNTYGSYINFDCIRNEGYLSFDINKSMTKTYESNRKSFVIAGLLLEVSDGKIAKNLYNGGNIVVQHTESEASTVYGILYIGGICYKNNNMKAITSSTYGSSWTSSDGIMIPSSLKGSLYNAVNNGNIFVYDTVGWGGTIRIGGIAVLSSSLISDSANLGNIEANAKVTAIAGGYNGSGEFEIEAAGIVFLLLGSESDAYGSLKDCVNYGNVITYNPTTTLVWTLSSGIVGRNDKSEFGGDKENSVYNGWASRIEYCINYGNIYAFNTCSTTSYWYQSISRSSGLFGCGLLSIVNSINYGNVYSKCEAGGIYCYTRTNAYSSPTFIFISNSINYGNVKNSTNTKVSANTSLDLKTTSSFNEVTLGTLNNGSSLSNATGGIIAHFRPNSTTTDTCLKMFSVSCLYNFSDVNMFGIVYDTTNRTSMSATATSQKLVKGMGTTYKSDSSPAPFNTTSGTYAQKIPYYTYDASENGIFASTFALQKGVSDGTVTSEYILDYIRYVPTANVGGYTSDSEKTGLASKLNISSTSKPGIYALSDSSGVANGVLLPENIDLDAMSPIDSKGDKDHSWYGNATDGSSVSWKIYSDMLQQKKSMASTIFDGELVATDSDGKTYTLTDPVIDQKNKTITYYVADNDIGKFSGEYKFIATEVAFKALSQENMTYATSDSLPYNKNAVIDTTTSDTYYVYCYSQAYYESNLTTELYYSKYQLIVIDINTKSISVDTGNIQIDGSTSTFTTDTSTNTYTVSSSNMQSGANGNILVTLTTTNIADGTDLSKYITVYRVNDSGSEIETYPCKNGTPLWTLDENNNGVVSVTSTDDLYSTGTASIKFTATSDTRGGKYKIKISLNDVDTNNVNIVFTKTKLSTVGFESMVFNGASVSKNTSGVYESTCKFGYPLDVSDFTDNAEADTTYGWYPNTFIGHRSESGVEKSYYITFDYETQMVTVSVVGDSSYCYAYYKVTKELDENNNICYRFTLPTNASWVDDFIVKFSQNNGEYDISLYNKFYTDNTTSTKIKGDAISTYTEECKLDYNGTLSVKDITSSNETEQALAQKTSIPKYLERLSLSKFSTIRKIEYSYTLDSNNAKTHTFTYYLAPESATGQSGETTSITHIIKETYDADVTSFYVDGVKKDDEDKTNDDFDISIERTSTPSIIINYNLDYYDSTNGTFEVVAKYSETSDGEFKVDTSKCEVHLINNKYLILDFNSDDPGYIKVTLTYICSDTREVTFQEVLITKAKSSSSLLKNASFSSDNTLAVQNVYVDNVILTTSYETQTKDKITYGVRSGINYGTYNTSKIYWVAGEVSDTDVSSYTPTFTLPTGGTMYRIDDSVTITSSTDITSIDSKYLYSQDSDSWKADYTNATDEDFKFVKYVIFAEDYVEGDATYGSHYTYYYVAVVDKTYTVRFTVNVKFDSLTTQNKYHESSNLIFMTFVKYAYEDDNVTVSKNIDNYSTAISFLKQNDVNNFTGYYNGDKELKECSFPSNKSGVFLIKLDLLDGYKFTYTVNKKDKVYAQDETFEAKALLVPRNFTIDITITSTSTTNDWGEIGKAELSNS